MSFRLLYTPDFYEDLDRIAEFLIIRDPGLAERAIVAVQKALITLRDFPLRARRASREDPTLRELIVPFGSSGYVVLFRVYDSETLVIIAIRHQREETYE
jgi:plasmid stabilization system protein ParE